MADASERILKHRHRRKQLEAAAEDAWAILSQRRELLDSADTIAAFAQGRTLLKSPWTAEFAVLDMVVPLEGLEPPTRDLGRRRSVQLSYRGRNEVVEIAGLEPATSALRTPRSPS